MEKTIEVHCQRLINGLFSFTILDLCGYAFSGIITHLVLNSLEERHLFIHRVFLLRIPVSYLLEKLCSIYIYRILSYIYIFTCKHVLLKSVPKLVAIVVTTSQKKMVSGVSELASLTSLVARSRGKYTWVLSFYPSDATAKKSFVATTTMSPIITTFSVLCFLINMCYMILDTFYPKVFLYHRYILISQLRCGNDSVVEEALDKAVRDVAQVDIKDVRISKEELMVVMDTIGQHPTKDLEQMKECMGYQDFSALFQESEPCLDEVKEAFSVFDHNKDGFVDSRDLQRVLSDLGIREGANLDACEQMIVQHDRNGDGYLDLTDFSRLLETCLF